MRKPKRCPFCGARDPKVWTRESFDRRYGRTTERTTVFCQECGCRTEAHQRPRDAIRAWNRRASEPVVEPGPTLWQRAKYMWGRLWN